MLFSKLAFFFQGSSIVLVSPLCQKTSGNNVCAPILPRHNAFAQFVQELCILLAIHLICGIPY